MEMVALRFMLEYGTAPALILLVLVILIFKKDLVAKLDEMKEDIDDLRSRINYVEKEYVKRKEYYTDISGWRSDINRLGERIDKLTMEILKR